MSDVTAVPAFITAPTKEQTAVDIYDSQISRPPSISDEVTIDEALSSIEPGLGNMWGFDPTGDISLEDFGLSKPLDISVDSLKEGILNNPTIKSAYAGLSEIHQKYLFGASSIKDFQNKVQQQINGVTSSISSITNGALSGIYNFANSFFGTICHFNFKDINMTINLSINILNLSMIHKLKSIYNCVMSSPMLTPSMLSQIIKNMIPKIVIRGDIDFLKAICNTEHSKEVKRYAPNITEDFLKTYKIPDGQTALDYESLYDDILATYDELNPGWIYYNRDSISTDIVYDAIHVMDSSDDFKTVLRANANSYFLDIINNDGDLKSFTSYNTVKRKYYLAICENYKRGDAEKEFKKVYNRVKVS